jgi:hypothetical protein
MMYKLLMLVAAFLNTVPRLIDFGTGVIMCGQMYSPVGRWWYYTGQAASYVLMLWAARYPKSQFTYELVIWLAISNLTDEMFFDPKVLGLNECIFAIFIPSYLFYEYRRKGFN